MSRAAARMLMVLLALAWGARPVVAGDAGGAGAESPPAPGGAAADSVTVQPIDLYLRSLADSTDRRYGRAAAPVDTAGLDSALAAALELDAPGPRRSMPFHLLPWLDFNRVDAALYGASGQIGSPRRRGALGGRLGWSAGPNEVRGAATLERSWGTRRSGALWQARAWAGRQSDPLDSDHGHSALAASRAFLFGNDLNDYLRRDGVRLRVVRETAALRLTLGARDQLESPLVTTSTWNLVHAHPQRIGNLPAALRRVHELEAGGTWLVPRLPLWVEGEWRISDGAFGSNADYRRTRVAAATVVPIRRYASWVTQATWGRTDGELLQQNAHWIGGRRTLRTVSESIAGSGRAVARTELVAAPDLLGWLPADRRALFNLQLGLFAGTGGVFGIDPLSGRAYEGQDWPARADWLSEAGVSFLYRTGIPDPRWYYRFDLTRVLGPRAGGWGWRFGVGTAIELLHPVER